MKHSLIEISLSGIDDELTQSVVDLFDKWGRGGAVIEQIVGEATGSRVKAYLPPEDDQGLRQIEIGLALLSRARDAGGEAAPGPGLPEPRIRFLSETDWAEAWKSNYHVLHVGRRLVVKPTWRDYAAKPDDLIITLDPGMAFGSGLHPSTRLCLEALEDYLRPGASVLDVGTGSGILAIAAARLGASRVLALDTDPLAIQVARENIALNQVDRSVHVEVGSLIFSRGSHPDFWGFENPKSLHPGHRIPAAGPSQASSQPPSLISDLVLANILAETIIELAPALAASLAPDGILITSGIIADRTHSVVASLRENGLSLAERRSQAEWVALVAGKVEENDASPLLYPL